MDGLFILHLHTMLLNKKITHIEGAKNIYLDESRAYRPSLGK